MFRRLTFTFLGIILLSYLFVGCGVRPQMDFYMVPVATEAELMKVNAETRSATMENKRFSITISPLDAADLLAVTSDAHINPYIYVSDWGLARQRYTIFDVAIKNKGESALELDLSNAVLMDEEGNQYEAIPYEEFRERYSSYPRLEREIVYHRSPYYRGPNYYRNRFYRPWYYHYDHYRGRRSSYVRRVYDVSYLARSILKGTMLKSVKLYPGGKNQGFLVFPLVEPDAARLKIIIPDMDMEFLFDRRPVVED